jgi:hypothetical protein
VFNRAKGRGDDLERCFEHWNWKDSNRGYNVVRVGRCDVGYPGFKEARMVLIDLPDSSVEGEEGYV